MFNRFSAPASAQFLATPPGIRPAMRDEAVKALNITERPMFGRSTLSATCDKEAPLAFEVWYLVKRKGMRRLSITD